MVSFRQVTITNEAQTERIELNDFDGYIMTSPTGFGVYRTSEYITVGNQRITSTNKPTFQKITFNVLIMGERSSWEQKYAVLRDFISRNIYKGFRLYYTPENETRYIKCDINILDKTEKDRANLPVKLEIQPLSLWLTDVQKDTAQQTASGGGFKFVANDYDEYSAKFGAISQVEDEYGRQWYAIMFRGSGSQVAVLNNAGAETTPMKIRIYGRAVNPIVFLKKYGSGQVVQFIKFNDLTIPEGYYLEINSDPTDTYIELVNQTTGERFDRESYADIESNMYIVLPQGQFILSLTDDAETGHAEAYFSNQYYGG